ncbi:hypothetical protein IQ22_01662 [Pseudomonas duriflava]|uniref:Uncharacterized protein n=1 Tax=Pseudomonas duriflava TaxID=459528 RepID=A0A562QG76_9PSED|nr:hypothetical protein [Pseudomonas duriflava]TWI55729.1 hypothetical protein IQ22_01662 [Pseudomonas duriflava]
MRIGCLAWGSLLWKPGPLPLASSWMNDGPLLPVELCRECDGGELAVALCDSAPESPTYWALLAVDDLDTARELLRQREGISPQRPEFVGSIPARENAGPYDEKIRAWADEKQLDAVVWTALPPKSRSTEGRLPTPDEAVAYLAALHGDTQAHARDYVRQLPLELRTPYRSVIEQRLGWLPTEEAAF